MKSEKEYLNYLSKYIQSENKLERIKIPPSTIDENSSVRTLIKDLIDVQFNRSLLVEAGKLKNPAVKLYDRTTTQIISSLNEAIFTSNTTLDIEIKRNNKIINELNFEINKLPEVERELLKIQRIQTINENIYTFLLRKKNLRLISHLHQMSQIQEFLNLQYILIRIHYYQTKAKIIFLHYYLDLFFLFIFSDHRYFK